MVDPWFAVVADPGGEGLLELLDQSYVIVDELVAVDPGLVPEFIGCFVGC